MKEGAHWRLRRGLDLVRKAMVKATARAVEAETEGGKGVAEGQTWFGLFGLWDIRGGVEGGLLLDAVGRLGTEAPALDVQEVAAGAERTNPKRAEGTTGHVSATPMRMALLRRVVNKQAAAAIVTVAGCVVAPAQLRFVFWMVEGDVQLMEAVCKLAALAILAEAGGRVAGAELRLVTSGTDPGDRSWRGGGFHLGKEGLCQGDSCTISFGILTGQQGVHHLLVLA